ncbi:MAG TPA: cytochrome b/b6 domain-containing protein [Mycobacteriales bacterium]|nr:cytochrome b/b6 domain-containing protein [Mycobacteriales bacterium]
MTATATAKPDTLPRFTRAERWVHRTTGALVAVLTATGAVLYYEPFALAVGRRPLVEGLHIAAGLLLPVPAIVGAFASTSLRTDFVILGRMTRTDWQWLRRNDRRIARLPVDKFNGGQKLASAVLLGGLLVLFGTGLLLIAPVRIDLPVGMRQGATIVHDLFTFAVLLLLAGHAWLAVRHPEARRALRTGRMDRRYAESEYAGWAREVQRKR